MNRAVFEFSRLDEMEEKLTQIESIAAVLLSAPGDLSMATAQGSVWAMQKLAEEAKQAAASVKLSAS